MGDSVFRKIQKILEKPEPPAHIRERHYQVVIPWYRQFWNAIRPPAPVGKERKPATPSQKRMMWITAAVVLPAVAGWWIYNYISEAPIRARASYDEGMRLGASLDYKGAVTKLSESLDISASARALLERGNAYRELDQTDNAMADWAKAIALDPSLAEAYTARGTHYRLAGDKTKALEDLDASIRIQPSVDAYYQRGQVYASLGQFDKAIEDYDEAIERRREAPYVYLARSVARRAIGDEEGYKQDQKTATELQK
jgi:tetratricopeptide (TPR) repeat protein